MKILVAILTLVAMATSGCGGGGGDSSTTTGVKTQEVLNWQVVGEGPDPDYKIVRFFTKTTISPLLAAIPEAVLAGQRDVVSLYYGDLSADTGAGAGYDELLGLLRTAKLIDREAVALLSLRGDGEEDEIPTQRALFEFLATEFNIELFNLYGEGNGAVVVASIYQHLPLQHLVATVGLPSPSFDGHGYRPYDHVEKLVGLEPPIPILLVYDRGDVDSVRSARVYLERAERLRISLISVVEVKDQEPSSDGTTDELADLLRDREYEEYRPEVARKADRIVSDGSVGAELLAELRDDMDLSRDYAKEHMVLSPPPSDVFVGSDPEWLADRYLEAFRLPEGFRQGKVATFSSCGPGEGGHTAMFIPACNRDWLDAPRERRAFGNAHEWFHVNVQFEYLGVVCCSGGTGIPVYGPQWLIEGAAEVWGSLVTNDFTNDIEYEKAWRRQQVPAGFDLMALNTRRGWQDAPGRKWEARDLAVWMLVEMAGLSGLERFYRLLGEYIADEAAREVLVINRHQNSEVRDFINHFFEIPRRQRRLDGIFSDAFGQTMERFATSFREYLSR